MTRTANATYADKITCLIWLADAAGTPFTCAECGKPILPGQKVHFDHRQAVGRGGANTFRDLRPVHAEAKGSEDGQGNPLDCHYRKTCRPRSLATTLGGDNYEAKKTTRLAEAQADAGPGRRRTWPSRPIPSRSLQGRSHWPAKGSRPLRRAKP